MRIIKLVSCAFLLAVFISYGKPPSDDTSEYPPASYSYACKTSVENAEACEIIHSVYDKFVFAIDTEGETAVPENYFTAKALKKLQDDYMFDCSGNTCYAYYALRTENQDSRPDSDGSSMIYDIKPAENGWYVVSYSDMGWPGKTRVKIYYGKIDDYERME